MKTFILSVEEFEALQEDWCGFCVSCGTEHDGLEGDASNVECENCGADLVFGMDELLFNGRIEIE